MAKIMVQTFQPQRRTNTTTCDSAYLEIKSPQAINMENSKAKKENL